MGLSSFEKCAWGMLTSVCGMNKDVHKEPEGVKCGINIGTKVYLAYLDTISVKESYITNMHYETYGVEYRVKHYDLPFTFYDGMFGIGAWSSRECKPTGHLTRDEAVAYIESVIRVRLLDLKGGYR